MNYPDCPESRDDCRFQNLGGTRTLLYSPIVYDRDGKPVGGGSNRVTTAVRCNTCNQTWAKTQTELEIAQDKSAQWTLS